MPLSDRTLETLPLTEFDPSEGKGPLVSTGSATQLALAEELELELLELLELELELLELELELLLLELLVLSSLLPPQATSVAAAPPEISQPSIWRRSLSRCSRCCLTIASRWFCRPWSWSLGRWRVMLAFLLGRHRVWREMHTTRRALQQIAGVCRTLTQFVRFVAGMTYAAYTALLLMADELTGPRRGPAIPDTRCRRRSGLA
jgi:hypothetical protein